jgi:hypothetical protein
MSTCSDRGGARPSLEAAGCGLAPAAGADRACIFKFNNAMTGTINPFYPCWHKCQANKHAERLGAAILRRHRSYRCVSLVRPLPTVQTGEGHLLDLCQGQPAKDLRTSPGHDPVGVAHLRLL